MGNEELKLIVSEFLEKKDKLVLVIYLTPAGALHVSDTGPDSSKTKGVFFVKRSERTVPKEELKIK